MSIRGLTQHSDGSWTLHLQGSDLHVGANELELAFYAFDRAYPDEVVEVLEETRYSVLIGSTQRPTVFLRVFIGGSTANALDAYRSVIRAALAGVTDSAIPLAG